MFVDKFKEAIDIDVPYTDPATGTQYPNLHNPDVRAALGITEITPPAKKDPLYYDVVESTTPPYVTNTPKKVADTTTTDPLTGKQVVIKGLRSQLIDRVNADAAAKLAPTDWAIIRAAEGYKPAPASIVAERKAIRDNANAIVAQLKAAKTHAALVKIKL